MIAPARDAITVTPQQWMLVLRWADLSRPLESGPSVSPRMAWGGWGGMPIVTMQFPREVRPQGGWSSYGQPWRWRLCGLRCQALGDPDAGRVRVVPFEGDSHSIASAESLLS
jgi:hypothetical protein